jgi:hypothetical protein
MSRLRSRVTYANVTATIALFIALGGTSYAVTQLPRNSVGAQQIRRGAVAGSEIRSGAVRSTDVENRTLLIRDLSPEARRSLRGKTGPVGPQGPPGPGTIFAAAVTSSGVVARSVGVSANGYAGNSSYMVGFNRDVSACFAVATLSDVPEGGMSVPENGEIVTSIKGSSVFVRTRNSSGTPADLPFHLVVSC